MVTTTSRCSTSQIRMAARIAVASRSACRHAASGPRVSRPAAASAARSATACARWRATSTAPSQIPPRAIATRAATSRAARTVAAPASSPTRLGSRDGLRGDEHPGQHGRAATDPGDDIVAVEAHIRRCPRRGETGGRRGRGGITTCRQPRRLPCGVDTSHLHRDSGDAREAERQHGNQGGDGQRGFDRAEPTIAP